MQVGPNSEGVGRHGAVACRTYGARFPWRSGNGSSIATGIGLVLNVFGFFQGSRVRGFSGVG